MPFVMTRELTGSAKLSTSTESSVDLLLLERNTGDFAEKDICTTGPDLLAGQPGRGTRPSLFVVIVDYLNVLFVVGIRNVANMIVTYDLKLRLIENVFVLFGSFITF